MKTKKQRPEDAFIRQDVMDFFDAVSRGLAAWLHGKLLRHEGRIGGIVGFGEGSMEKLFKSQGQFETSRGCKTLIIRKLDENC